MRITLIDSASPIATIPRFQHVILRVISGTILIGRDRQSVENGGGLPASVADGIVTLAWDAGPLFMAAASGTQATAEVIVPQ